MWIQCDRLSVQLELVYNYGFLVNCKPVGQVSDSKTALTYSFSQLDAV